jgi:beta-glucanase (GH16 family)
MNNMIQKFFRFVFILFLVPSLYQCTSVSGEKGVTVEKKAEPSIVFFDDFSGPGLDTSKWNAEITGNHFNNELQAYVDSSEVIKFVDNAEGAKNGALVIQPVFTPGFVTRDGQHFDFISGRINTKNKVDVTYGSISARIKIIGGAGAWPAFWMLGHDKWPETGEIDIMENIGEKDWANAAVHGPGYSGDAGLADKQYFLDSNDVSQWHIYSVDCTPDSLIFKYDDKLMFRVTKPMTEFFGKWVFDNPKFILLNFAVGGIYPYKINGIKQPYYGLATSTLNQIKEGRSKMIVDWVKVTGR